MEEENRIFRKIKRTNTQRKRQTDSAGGGGKGKDRVHRLQMGGVSIEMLILLGLKQIDRISCLHYS